MQWEREHLVLLYIIQLKKMFLQQQGAMGAYRWKVTKLHWIRDNGQGNITVKKHLEKEETGCITALPSLGHCPGPRLKNFIPRSDLRE